MGGVIIRALVDSGSTTNVVDGNTWKYLKKNKVKCVSEKCTTRLYPYGTRQPLATLGNFQTTVEIQNRKVDAKFTVVEGTGKTLLSKGTAE